MCRGIISYALFRVHGLHNLTGELWVHNLIQSHYIIVCLVGSVRTVLTLRPFFLRWVRKWLGWHCVVLVSSDRFFALLREEGNTFAVTLLFVIFSNTCRCWWISWCLMVRRRRGWLNMPIREHGDKIWNLFADGEGVTANDLVDRLGNRGWWSLHGESGTLLVWNCLYSACKGQHCRWCNILQICVRTARKF